MGPLAEFLFHGNDYAVEGWKILVMETKPTRQFPDAFLVAERSLYGVSTVESGRRKSGSSPSEPLRQSSGLELR